ncbi:hypothetical protein B0H21DRAFT_739809 [Amylocystis lapponica]|nr:hypothetical protein B0H21DRAFT_739809 [Amylocystis lapponica]
MERHCGHLQRAIKSRRFPYTNLEQYLTDSTRLRHITVVYNLGHQLKLKQPVISSQNLTLPNYPTCMLLPPHGKYDASVYGLMEKIVGAIATRFNTTAATARRHVPVAIDTWGKVKILPNGDTIHAAASSKAREDRRDASYVRYEVLIDVNAQYRRRPVILKKQMLFGQLRHLLVMRLLASHQLHLDTPTTLVFAVIKSCTVESSHSVLDIHYYSDEGAFDVVDVTCVQCLVGRVRNGDGGQWAIVDRSGPLSRAIYANESG